MEKAYFCRVVYIRCFPKIFYQSQHILQMNYITINSFVRFYSLVMKYRKNSQINLILKCLFLSNNNILATSSNGDLPNHGFVKKSYLLNDMKQRNDTCFWHVALFDLEPLLETLQFFAICHGSYEPLNFLRCSTLSGQCPIFISWAEIFNSLFRLSLGFSLLFCNLTQSL